MGETLSMPNPPSFIPINNLVLDNEIYPRSAIDHRRVRMFADNLRDGFEFDPIHVQAHPEEKGKYRILDGAHRWQAYKDVGAREVTARIIKLDGNDPLLYAAKQAIGPRQLNEEESRDTARRAYQKNPRLTSGEIGKAIGRSRRTVDSYISDLRATVQLDLNLKIFRMGILGIPQERIAGRLGFDQKTIHSHLGEKAELPFLLNSDLKKGFTVPQVAEKHGWPEPLVWSLALEGKEDLERFRELKWGLRTWDLWNWNDCDSRFGDDWPGRIPAQLVGHILYFFSKQNDLIFDPMAGGGVVADTALALNRRCWSFDMKDTADARPEIEPYFWDLNNLKWPVYGKTRPDLILFDPPYFSKKAEDYDENSISGLSRKAYLDFLGRFFKLAYANSKKSTTLAFINADWRDFQNKAADDEVRDQSILINDYLRVINKGGWTETHVIQAPMSSERFQANVVAAMQKRKILGVTSRYVVVAKYRL
jgi:DNA-binding CsgD family transcriptional regulator